MRTYPEADELEDLEKLKVEPWMVELLKVNPEYVFWGPREDYMWRLSEDDPDFNPEIHQPAAQWESRVIKNSWKDFGPWELDKLNEVVNFYFQLSRETESCKTCGKTGYHPDALWVSESFYQHSSPFRIRTFEEERVSLFMQRICGSIKEPLPITEQNGFPSEEILSKYKPEFRIFCEQMANGDGHWDDKITEDEVDALWEENRLDHDKEKPTAAEVNELQHKRGCGLVSHDGINRSILVKTRLERFGMPNYCPTCEGHGYNYTAPQGHLNLILWVLHPRKGCSRGIEIQNIQKEDLPDIQKYLQTAAKRNAERFSRVSSIIA